MGETTWRSQQRDDLEISRFGLLWKVYDIVGQLGLQYRPPILPAVLPNYLGGLLFKKVDVRKRRRRDKVCVLTFPGLGIRSRGEGERGQLFESLGKSISLCNLSSLPRASESLSLYDAPRHEEPG